MNSSCCETDKRRSLPPEIVEEILCNLPVKSLNRFRTVSTSWQSLISNPLFMRKHHATQSDNLFKKILISSNPMNIRNDYPDVLPLSDLFPYEYGISWRFIASCDGLICMQPNRTGFGKLWFLYICNPYMKIHRRIQYDPSFTPTSFGFGYDAKRDDYKIMALDRVKAEIYSLKTGQWTRVADFPGDMSNSRCESVFADGAIHWLHLKTKSVFSFDLSENNKFIKVPLPEYELMPCYPRQVSPFALREMLCVLINGKKGLVLWAKGQKSWTRILAIPFSEVMFCNFSFNDYLKPLYVYDSGEVLMGDSSDCEALIGGRTYDKTLTQLLICKENKIVFRQIIRHHWLTFAVKQEGFLRVESLISPPNMFPSPL